ncbi:hypothetical protein POVWA2_007660 [Plasmodium ovale wallikeri]|uniref:Uncharacterized protein n=1 Tax=Plasmodium ovale wallikeri TaxID=864142 RepID=A0A1A8YKJ0_PLAOA|nr:hypothetical protein POVWA2_007660 [Plasmodium ovale wallikeri]
MGKIVRTWLNFLQSRSLHCGKSHIRTDHRVVRKATNVCCSPLRGKNYARTASPNPESAHLKHFQTSTTVIKLKFAILKMSQGIFTKTKKKKKGKKGKKKKKKRLEASGILYHNCAHTHEHACTLWERTDVCSIPRWAKA